MATFKKTLSGDNRYRIELKVTESNTNISTNTSDVDYELAAYRNYSSGGYWTSSKTNPIKVVIDGSTIVNKNIAYDFRNTTKIVLASGTVRDIQHNVDGTKTIQCSGYFKDNENSLGSGTASGSLTLTQLHKAPEPYIETITEMNTTLTSRGIANDTFVANLSAKKITVDSTTYDEATVSSNAYVIKNGNTIGAYFPSSGYYLLNFTSNPLTIEDNKVKLEITATDSMGAKGTTIVEYNNYIPYTKPTLIESELKTPRDGQLTGKVKLIAKGSYYSGNDLVVTPKVYYRYGVKDSGEYSDWTDLIPTYQNGNWELEADIGAERGTSETPPSNWFNPEKMYEVQVYVKDTINSSSRTYSSYVLLGDAIMTKYKDKVDFKKLTIKKKQILAPYILYEGNESMTDSNITLEDDVSNYQYLEIFYFYYADLDDIKCKSSIKIYNPNGNIAMLTGNYDNGTRYYSETARYTINGTSMIRSLATRWRFGTGGENNTRANTTSSNQSIFIYRVVGYK